MQPDYCYIYVQGWKADDDFEKRAQAAADGVPKRECVIVSAEEEWPNFLPELSAEECAAIICGCEGHPNEGVKCTANDYRINKTFLDVEGAC